MQRIVVALLFAFLAARSPGAYADDRVCSGGARPANLNFTLKDVNGRNVRFKAYRGQVILLDFWATWCTPCRVEIPWLNELHSKYRKQGFVVLGVSVDAEIELVKPFAATLKMNYPVLIGAGRDDLSAAFGPFAGFPTSMLIARDGTICVRHTGLPRKAELEREVAALLQR